MDTDEGTTSTPSVAVSIRVHRWLTTNYAAIETDPPGRLVPTGAHAGPLCLRPLNQNAVSQTRAPAAVEFGNTTPKVALPAFPSNCHDPMSFGGVAV
jgi:hypothetical protein